MSAPDEKLIRIIVGLCDAGSGPGLTNKARAFTSPVVSIFIVVPAGAPFPFRSASQKAALVSLVTMVLDALLAAADDAGGNLLSK